jgi:hypothetical protein
MPKSKASEATEQELAAMKMGLEGMNMRQEDIGGKMDTVQAQMTELTDKFSRLEALFTATLEKTSADPVVPPPKDKPTSSSDKNELIWHEGPPHWRRRNDIDAPPRYENPPPENPESHPTHPESHESHLEIHTHHHIPQHNDASTNKMGTNTNPNSFPQINHLPITNFHHITLT